MADVEWDAAAPPASPTTGELLGRMDADTVRIWKGTPHPEEAFEFLTWLIGPGGTEPLIMAIGSVEPGYAAYGGFPAMTEYQASYFEGKTEQFPFVTNWALFEQTLGFPDNPSAEAWRPNSVEAVNRMDTFKNLWENDGTIDFDAEYQTLLEDLETIYNKLACVL
jgi:multiple sugar transport system substrate-binding protein